MQWLLTLGKANAEGVSGHGDLEPLQRRNQSLVEVDLCPGQDRRYELLELQVLHVDQLLDLVALRRVRRLSDSLLH